MESPPAAFGFAFDGVRYPQHPGVYVVRDEAGTPVYVGKANNLRRRLASHFADPQGRVARNAAAVDVILTRTEREALVLEDALIKRHRPRLNRARMQDDESYFCIVLTDERPPRLLPYRKNRRNVDLEKANARPRHTFGPYTSRRYRDTLLTLVANRFGLRTCDDPMPRTTCLRYDLDTCTGICAGHRSEADYEADVRKAVRFLRQPPARAIAAIERDMTAAARAQQFERAEVLKKQRDALQAAAAKQAVETDRRRRASARTQTLTYVDGEHAVVATVDRGVVVDLSLARTDELHADPDPAARPSAALADLCRLNLAYWTDASSITSSSRRTSSRGGTPFSR